METITTTTTVKDATITVTATSDQVNAFMESEVRKLQDKLNALKAADQGGILEIMLKTVKGKLDKMDTVPAAISWDDLRKRARSADSLAAYLEEQGIEKTLHGSASRAYKVGAAVKESLSRITDDELVIKDEVLKSLYSKKEKPAWVDAVMEFLFS